MQTILQNLNSTPEQVEDAKASQIRRKNNLEDVDNKLILDKFYRGALNINDYKEDNYKKIYLDLTSKDVSKLSEKEKAEMDENIEKLNNNLNEYSKYTEYKFLVDGVLEIRENELKEIEKNKAQKVKKTQYELVK